MVDFESRYEYLLRNAIARRLGESSILGTLCRKSNSEYEVELHVHRNHTEQKDVIKTTLYEPRGKSRYRVEGTERMHSEKPLELLRGAFLI